MKIEALLFDLGGVVTEIDFERVWARWARDAGCHPDSIRLSFSRYQPYLRYECAAISLEEYFSCLRETMNVSLSDAELLAGWNDIFVGEMPGIVRLLESLAPKIPLYAFTNTNRAHEECWSVRFAGTLSHFKRIFVSSTMGLRKPEKPAFDHVVKEIGVPAGAVLFFDDSLENVEGARAAGLQAEHVRSTAEIAAALKRYFL